MPKLKRPLYGPGDPRGPVTGRDVIAVKRGLNKVETDFFPKPPGGFDDVYNAKTEEAIQVFQRINSIKATGQFGQLTLDELWPYFDAYAKYIYRTFVVPKPPVVPAPETLVEPVQGFASLHKSLWEIYSVGRRMGFADLGTYNAASTLPSGAPSDHAVYPSLAFDLGISPASGWDNIPARQFFYAAMGRAEVEYVILGDKIWSRPRASEGIRLYTGGGHGNHLHVSGNR